MASCWKEADMTEGSVDFYSRLRKISFQSFHIGRSLEFKGEVGENVYILSVAQTPNSAHISRGCSAGGSGVRGFSIPYVFDYTVGVLCSWNYVTLNLWGEVRSICWECFARSAWHSCSWHHIFVLQTNKTAVGNSAAHLRRVVALWSCGKGDHSKSHLERTGDSWPESRCLVDPSPLSTELT